MTCTWVTAMRSELHSTCWLECIPPPILFASCSRALPCQWNKATARNPYKLMLCIASSLLYKTAPDSLDPPLATVQDQCKTTTYKEENKDERPDEEEYSGQASECRVCAIVHSTWALGGLQESDASVQRWKSKLNCVCQYLLHIKSDATCHDKHSITATT